MRNCQEIATAYTRNYKIQFKKICLKERSVGREGRDKREEKGREGKGEVIKKSKQPAGVAQW